MDDNLASASVGRAFTLDGREKPPSRSKETGRARSPNSEAVKTYSDKELEGITTGQLTNIIN